jgi:cytoskeleton protein RodZ
VKRKNNRNNFKPSFDATNQSETMETQSSLVMEETGEKHHPPEEKIEPPKETELSIGPWLKSLRENKKADLLDISRFTKINPTLLEALEAEDFANLPPSTYLRGFIKSYCHYLSADAEVGLLLLKKTLSQPGLAELAKKTQYRVRDTTREHRQQKLKRQLPVYLVTAIFMIGAAIVWKTQLQTEFQEETEIEPVKVEEKTVTPTVTPMPTPEKKVEEIPQTLEAENDIAVEEESDVEVKIPPVQEVASASPKTTFSNGKRVINTLLPHSEVEKLSDITSPLFAYGAMTEELKAILPEENWNSSADLQKVFIKAVDGDSWITYKKDDAPIKKFVLSEDKTLMITGKVIRLFMGNVQATRIFHNGKPIVLDTRSGVKSFIFPIEMSKEFKLPLFHYFEDGSAITTVE